MIKNFIRLGGLVAAMGALALPTIAAAASVTVPVVKDVLGRPIPATAVISVDTTGTYVAPGGGTSDATAANQTTQITAAQLTNTTLGAVTASPTANTIGDRLKAINTTLMSPLAVSQSGTWTDTVTQATASNLNAQIVGNIASLGADSGNPIKIGGTFNTAPPTATNGQRVDWQMTNRGEGIVAFGLAGGSVSSVNGGMADSVSNTVGTYRFINRLELYNGSTWDKNRAVTNATDSTGIGIMAAGLVAQLDDTSPSTITENQFGNLRMTQNRALLIRPYATASQDWTYVAASGGISNTTTAVTLVGATASMRNYITACQVSADALGAATEVVIRDGASGTVLQRIKLTTAGLAPVNMEFPTPLKSTANTLLEAATLTATITGGVYINCQGFTAP